MHPDCIDANSRRYNSHLWSREICDLPLEVCTNCGQRRLIVAPTRGEETQRLLELDVTQHKPTCMCDACRLQRGRPAARKRGDEHASTPDSLDRSRVIGMLDGYEAQYGPIPPWKRKMVIDLMCAPNVEATAMRSYTWAEIQQAVQRTYEAGATIDWRTQERSGKRAHD